MTAATGRGDDPPKPPAGTGRGDDPPKPAAGTGRGDDPPKPSRGPVLDENGLARALRPVIGPVSIEGVARLSGGASRETWSFDAVAPDGSRTELVLRRDPPGRPSESGALARESAAIGAAASAGLAAPEVLLVHSDGADTGAAGMVMRRVAGETIARRILRDEQYAAARGLLVRQLAEFAAGLHALDVPIAFPRPDPLAQLRQQLDSFGRPSEVFELALDWLGAHPPPGRAPVLLHGDFRLGNLVVGPDGLRAVLDWELTHLGNPAEDLGWLCVKAWRFGSPLPVAGVGTRADLLADYRAAGGPDIAPAELRWWETLGTLRWGVICLSQAWAHLSGAHRSVELAAIGRRVCEQEWDLLLLLEPESARRAAAARPHPTGDGLGSPAPYGRPTASELLAAVREYLLDSVLPQTSGQLSFHARVAANALAIAARELEQGPIEPGAELADRVAARLAVANPKYFDSPPP
jgi:aminoglycoside phosphotransferase (APT) family kinase protein